MLWPSAGQPPDRHRDRAEPHQRQNRDMRRGEPVGAGWSAVDDGADEPSVPRQRARRMPATAWVITGPRRPHGVHTMPGRDCRAGPVLLLSHGHRWPCGRRPVMSRVFYSWLDRLPGRARRRVDTALPAVTGELVGEQSQSPLSGVLVLALARPTAPISVCHRGNVCVSAADRRKNATHCGQSPKRFLSESSLPDRLGRDLVTRTVVSTVVRRQPPPFPGRRGLPERHPPR